MYDGDFCVLEIGGSFVLFVIDYVWDVLLIDLIIIDNVVVVRVIVGNFGNVLVGFLFYDFVSIFFLLFV